MLRSTRFRFWWQLVAIAILKPRLLYDYIVALGAGEHFFDYRNVVKAQLEGQLAALDSEAPSKPAAAAWEATSAYASTP